MSPLSIEEIVIGLQMQPETFEIDGDWVVHKRSGQCVVARSVAQGKRTVSAPALVCADEEYCLHMAARLWYLRHILPAEIEAAIKKCAQPRGLRERIARWTRRAFPKPRVRALDMYALAFSQASSNTNRGGDDAPSRPASKPILPLAPSQSVNLRTTQRDRAPSPQPAYALNRNVEQIREPEHNRRHDSFRARWL